MNGLEIRKASVAEFSTALDWAAAEGWNPGLDDMQVFHETDPDGFLMGFLDDEPISSISVVRYGDHYGFLGFYIVAPKHRGKGAGIATWNAGLAHLGHRTVGLDGVVAQQDNYRRSGFVLAGRNIRYRGVPDLGEPPIGTDIRMITAKDLNAILAYDSDFFPEPRAPFAASWCLPGSGERRTGIFATENGAVAVYGVVRECRLGYKIGPLFADNEKTAGALFDALCRQAPAGAQLSLDVPETNGAAVTLANRYRLRPIFETARMYKGLHPNLPLARTYGITTFELG